RTEVHSLEARSVRCLEKVSGLLAALYAASRDSEISASRSSGIGAFAHRIAQEEDLDRACRGFLEAVREHTPCRRAILTLLDAEMKAYQWFFAGLSEPEMDRLHRNPMPEEKCRDLFRKPGSGGLLRRENARTFLLLTGPRERPLGFLTLPDAEDGKPPTESDLASLEILADLLSSAIDRFQLAAELKRERNRLQKSQEQLVHSERLSAIGQLVSGVAHELNNPLAGVVGFAELVARSNADPKCARDLQRIIHEAQRCQHIVQNLLNFARRTKAERRPMDINELVENVLDLRSHQLRLDNVQIQMNLAAELPQTAGDHHQIQQVFLNIINNAHQAMQEIDAARSLKISTRAAADRIIIRFEDTGPGIPQARLARVFEPFFTTKAAGKGTGLGLSLSQGIVKEHGGRIRVESTMDKGTTFTVELPVLASEEETAVSVTGSARSAASSPHSVLVVDDEEVIVDLLHEVLVRAGHRVETARDGEQALRKILSGGYDAVISDLKMPGMDGAELYDAVCREKPEMSSRFVFSTGDVASMATQDFFQKTGCPYLMKPFDLKAVRDTLDRLFSRA
ncbi:MAG TPA: ATP-binding protein, partial [Candidatus Polarisedimenticolia bacterium]|nr:ATP-binding protein [Candidatus Polarisedimenticolia bacterium]